MLKGKCAVVTGSTSGIGVGIARALAAEGCNLALNGFADEATVATLEEEFRERYGVKATYSGADLRDPDQIAALVDHATRELGKVDVLVNNAGIQHTAPIEEFPVEKWNDIIAVNLSAAFHATRLVIPQMKARNWGRIINTASVHGLVASVNKAAYVSAKHGIVGLTRAVALETAETGITCNAICPGWTWTQLIERQIEDRAQALGVSIEEGARELLKEKQPSKEFVTVEQLGALAVFLCSDAASQLTGTALPVDGGWTAQ